jgi:tRNA (cytidine/uridine-2'-O-)-methyltransferase
VIFEQKNMTLSLKNKSLLDSRPEVVLVYPQIPQNTGAIARLCAAFQMKLNLIEPMGFSICEKKLKRAGLDYWPHVDLTVYENWDVFYTTRKKRRFVFVETGGVRSPHNFTFFSDDLLVFGSETKGLPVDLIENLLSGSPGELLTIPMFCGGVRSLNLAQAVAIVAYQALSSIEMNI